MRISTGTIYSLALCLTLSVSAAYGHGSGGLPLDHPKGGATQKSLPSTGTFTNFETGHVHPLAISPNGAQLAICNTADNRVEIYNIDGSTGQLTPAGSVPVGFDPITVRFRSNTELWCVNQISDSVSIIDVATMNVAATIQTDDEPADVVFYTDSGNSDSLAAVSCSRVDTVQVYDANTLALVDTLSVLGEDPRALATDGSAVFGAVFNSGNSTTIIGNALIGGTALADGTNPYAGFNPPFNNGIPGTAWVTPAGSKTPANLTSEGKPQPPFTGMILRKDYGDLAGDGKPKWKDNNGADWTEFVRGAKAATSRRLPGWDVIDNDMLRFTTSTGTAALDGAFGTSGYVINQMNICMALGINPANGTLAMVGIDSTNEVRFEPNITGTFARVRIAIVDGTTGAQVALVDMNEEHLDAAQGGMGMAYSDGSVPQADRNKSIGDPRSVAFDPTGARIYVTGMGSNNVVVIDAATGARLGGVGHTIDVGVGPTGAAHHGSLNRLYVLNRFGASISVVDTTTTGSETIVQTVNFYDPTPAFLNEGRVHFYNTHLNSGLGQIACASCHIDGAMDRLAWDLGDPFGEVKPTTLVNLVTPAAGEQNLSFSAESTFDDYHFMKGPMTTQTLQDIIGKEPHHWRGDRDGIEEFAGAFAGLQGRDTPLEAAPMQEFENFLSTLHFPPSPFRAVDNSLPGGPKFVGAGTNPLLPLPGLFTSGRAGAGFAAQGLPLPDGDAWRGFQLYVDGDPSAGSPPLDGSFNCVTCHTLPTGAGSLDFHNGATFLDVPPGPNGEAHMAIVSVDGTGEKAFKTPQLRNQLDKGGFYLGPDPGMGGGPRLSRAGFGVLHDGSIAGLDEFLASLVFDMTSDQDVADVIAFTLCINGDGFPELLTLAGAPTGDPAGIPGLRTPGPDGGQVRTGHAAVGTQVTITSATPSMGDLDLINDLVAMADAGSIDLVVKGTQFGANRGWFRGNTGAKAVGIFQGDVNGLTQSLAALLSIAGAGNALTFTAVPAGQGERMGVDRDEDTFFDFSEILAGSDPADPNSIIVGTSTQNWRFTLLILVMGMFYALYRWQMRNERRVG